MSERSAGSCPGALAIGVLAGLLIGPGWALLAALAGAALIVLRRRPLPELIAWSIVVLVGALVTIRERRNAPAPNGSWPGVFVPRPPSVGSGNCMALVTLDRPCTFIDIVTPVARVTESTRASAMPNREARHWKNMTPSAPRATWAMLLRASSPGRLAMLRGCQFTALVECSMSSQGAPPARLRVRSAHIASSTCRSVRSEAR